MAEFSIPFVKEVSKTSSDLAGDAGMTTRIKIKSQSKWNKEVTTDEILLYSDDKLITSINGKSIPHKRRKS